MQGAGETWAKGLAIALISLAKDEGRDAAVILFSTTAQQPILLKARDCNHDQLVKQVAGFWCGGGTNFQDPLQSAVKVISNYPEMKQAEIVFLTDGAASLDPRFKAEFLNVKQAMDFSLFCLELGYGSPHSGLGDLADERYRITDLHSPADIHELFTRL